MMYHYNNDSNIEELLRQDDDFYFEYQKNILALNPDFRRLLTQDVDITLGNFAYPCRLKLNPDVLYLSVQMHGDLPRGEGSSLPVFARWNWGNILGAHVLSICDPTIYQDDTLGIGWYLGNRYESAIHGIVAIAQRCAEIIGIPEDRIVFSGSSGGGFAALQAAAVAKNGRAIAINAQTNLSQHEMRHVNNYINKVSGCTSLQEAENVFAQRWNAIRSLQEAVAKGNTPKVIIVQNRNEWHYQKHFTPFADAFGLNLVEDQSIRGNFMSILYDGPHSHGPEPSEVVKRINNEGVPFLFNFHIDSFVPEISIEISQEQDSIIAEIFTNASDCQFACYFFKNGKIQEEKSYSFTNRFAFTTSGAGDYKCKGFVLDTANTDVFVYSETIHVS